MLGHLHDGSDFHRKHHNNQCPFKDILGRANLALSPCRLRSWYSGRHNSSVLELSSDLRLAYTHFSATITAFTSYSLRVITELMFYLTHILC